MGPSSKRSFTAKSLLRVGGGSSGADQQRPTTHAGESSASSDEQPSSQESNSSEAGTDSTVPSSPPSMPKKANQAKFDESVFADIEKKYRTDKFTQPSGGTLGSASTFIVRRDSKFTLKLSGSSSTSDAAPGTVTTTLNMGHDVPPTVVAGLCKANTAASIDCTLPKDAPVGVYTITLTVSSTVINAKMIVLFNPYPQRRRGAYAVERMRSGKDLQEYVESTEGLIFQGFGDNHTGHTWTFDQYNHANLAAALRQLDGLSVEDRRHPLKVSRHLTWSIGDRVCYGRWGDASYTSGKPDGGYKCASKHEVAADPEVHDRCSAPGRWTGSTVLLAQYTKLADLAAQQDADRKAGKKVTKRDAVVSTKVQYCQCFVFAGVYTTIGRALGLATRPVTTFQSAHDVNADRSISKWYDGPETNPAGTYEPIDQAECPSWCGRKASAAKKGCVDAAACSAKLHDATAETADAIWKECASCSPCVPCYSGHDSVWSFHVWNEVWFARRNGVVGKNLPSKLKRYSNGWQAVDSTPQEYSDGRYQMGPASVGLVKRNTDACFDGQFVISEVNADVKMWVTVAEPKGGFRLYDKFHMDPFKDEDTIGVKTVTKAPGPISDRCRSSGSKHGDCSSNELDLTLAYKYPEPSSGGLAKTGDCSDIDFKHADNSPGDGDTSAHFLQLAAASLASKNQTEVSDVDDQEEDASAIPSAGQCLGATASGCPKTEVECAACGKCDWTGDKCVRATSRKFNGFPVGGADNAMAADVEFKSSFFQGKGCSRRVKVGDSVSISVIVDGSKSTPKARTVQCLFRAVPYGYDGKPLVFKETRQGPVVTKLASVAKTVKLGPGTTAATFDATAVMNSKDLEGLGVDSDTTATIRFFFSATVKETKQAFIYETQRGLSAQ